MAQPAWLEHHRKSVGNGDSENDTVQGHCTATFVGAAHRRPLAPWQQAHDELSRLARARAGLDFEEGRCLLAAQREATHLRLGYGSFAEYIERLFGYGPRFTQEKLRVAEALEMLPGTADELRAGVATFSAVRELTRVATPTTECEWLAAARGKTAREVERLVSGHRPGSRPDDPVDASAKRHVLRFEVSGDVLAAFREALAKIRRDAGEPLDDDAAILLLARHVLGGSRDDGRASYQVALTICERCRSSTENGCGELVEVGGEVVAMAGCDAQHIGRIEGVRDTRGNGNDAHVGAIAAPIRAKQTVPPAVRRAVLRRDGGCCRVPGCCHATFLDVHHVEPRSEGGRHDAANLVTLCGAHHRALHRGELVVNAGASGALCFQHADGTLYGSVSSTVAVDVRAKAFQALRGLGFREGEVRRALEGAHVGAHGELSRVVTEALRRLTG